MSFKPDSFEIRESSLGRIVLPDDAPRTKPVFWTTEDFDGHIDPRVAEQILLVIRELGGESERFRTCRQVHGTTLVEVPLDAGHWAECDECDGLWTRRPGTALGIKIADCLPVTIVDDHGPGFVANLHAGWRGAAAGIVTRAVESIREQIDLSTVARVYLGPSIRVCCFEVGEEVVEAFRTTAPWIDQFVDRSGSKPHVDLAGLVRREMVELGFEEDRIWDGGLCTRCPGALFHSYRRSGSSAGRNLAIVGT